MGNPLLEKLEDMGAEVDDALERFMDDEVFYMECLKGFPQNQNIVELRRAVDAGDCDRAMREVHTLKGVALNLSFLPLADVCMDMLLDFRSGSNDEALARIDEVEHCFNEWARVITEG